MLVVSDRNVIDSQLAGGALRLRAHDAASWRPSRATTAARAASWPRRSSGDKKIVVCTIQTFPFALEAVRELAATQGKRFAVIADEAHSSQTGEAAAKLKAVLSPEELAGTRRRRRGQHRRHPGRADGGAGRATSGITYVAFTATPKAKTLELFGTRPDPTRKPAPDNLPAPFHVYSMRQAIEEGFILDVLQNYTPYKLAFKLAHDGKDYDDKEVERSAAMKGIMGWVRLHPYNIAQKVQIVVEHFREYVAPLLDGQGQGDGGGRQPRGGGALEAGHRQIHQGARLRHRHAGGLLGRGERQGVGPGPVHRKQQDAEPRT